MENNIRVMVLIGIMAVGTYLLRSMPFCIFQNKKTPAYIDFLGKYLPYAIMGMLVVYCLKGVSFLNAPFGIPEVLSVLLVTLLHVWKRNTLLSIVGGTACYMALIHIL